jgi:hypothetical protein
MMRSRMLGSKPEEVKKTKGWKKKKRESGDKSTRQETYEGKIQR